MWRLPSSLSLSFSNEGNVHVVPRGAVLIKNSAHKTVAKGIINPESSLILPGHKRTYKVSLASQKQFLWPGRYSVEYTYRFDGIDKFTTSVQSFRFYNLSLLFEAATVLVVVIFMMRFINRHFGSWIRSKLRFLTTFLEDIIVLIIKRAKRGWSR